MEEKESVTGQIARGNHISKGHILEYRIRRLFFYMGYFTKGNISIKTSQLKDALEITDLDVYGIYIHKDLSSKNIWADCKSGKVKANERITWIKGIMSTIEIDESIFVTLPTRTDVKKYAKNYNIQLMDISAIQEFERAYNIKEDDWSGSWNYEKQNKFANALNKIKIPNNTDYKKIHKFIFSDYWNLDSYLKLKKTITALKIIVECEKYPLNKFELQSVRWAKYELICLFLLSLLNISREVMYLNPLEKKQIILESLSLGEVNNQKSEQLFDAALRVAFSFVMKQLPDFKVPDDLPKINLTPPSYSNIIVDLVQRINSKPEYFYDLLRYLDYVFMEYELNNVELDTKKITDLFGNDEKLKIGAKSIIMAISDIVNIDKNEFKFLKN